MPGDNQLEKQKEYHPYEGFGLLSQSQALLQEHRGKLTEKRAQEITGLASLAVRLLVDYPYFIARAHRVLGEIMEETGDIPGAIYNYTKALEHDPKVGVKKKLTELDPGNPAGVIREKRPPFSIQNTVPGAIEPLSRRKSGQAGQAPRGSYYETAYFDRFCGYSKNHYDRSEGLSPDEPPSGETTISFTDLIGVWIGERRFSYLVYRFACGVDPEVIATISFDLKLRLYRPEKKTVERDISSGTNCYQVNGLFVSPDASLVYYSAGATLFVLDQNLESVAELKFSLPKSGGPLVPVEDVLEDLSPSRMEALAVLRLLGNPTNEKIQAAYRARLLDVHPDRHPDNPNAGEETREVIEAYEILTKAENRKENLGFHEQVFTMFRIFFPAFEDSITAFCFSADPRVLYVGYWSGLVLGVIDHRETVFVYQAGRAVRQLEEVNGSLYIRSDRVTIWRSGVGVKQVVESIDYGVSWKIFPENSLLVLRTGLQLALYTLDGELVGEIQIRDSIADYYILVGKLFVFTTPFIYEFAVRGWQAEQGRQMMTSNIS